MGNKILVLGLAGIFMVSCNTKVETKTTTEVAAVNEDSVKTVIQGMENTYAEAMNAGNADGVSSYYADDAVSYGQDEAPLSGKTAIMESLKKDIAEAKGKMTVAFTTNEVHLSSDGNQLVEIGAYKVVDSAKTPKYTGNFMALFEKKDGKYVCVRDMAASDMPKEKK